MLTRFITEVTTHFNPFNAASRSARLFLANLPAKARNDGMLINVKLLPRTTAAEGTTKLQVKFKDNKVMDLNCESMSIKELVSECDRHSRLLQKQAALADA